MLGRTNISSAAHQAIGGHELTLRILIQRNIHGKRYYLPLEDVIVAEMEVARTQHTWNRN